MHFVEIAVDFVIVCPCSTVICALMKNFDIFFVPNLLNACACLYVCIGLNRMSVDLLLFCFDGFFLLRFGFVSTDFFFNQLHNRSFALFAWVRIDHGSYTMNWPATNYITRVTLILIKCHVHSRSFPIKSIIYLYYSAFVRVTRAKVLHVCVYVRMHRIAELIIISKVLLHFSGGAFEVSFMFLLGGLE